MNNTLQNLKESIFFHLTANEDKPISLYSMWNQMLSPTGWRCEELKLCNKDFFITEFHCVPNDYKDIYKIYKQGVPYLVYTKKSLSEFDSIPPTNETYMFSLDEIVDSYINGNINITVDFVESLKILDNLHYKESDYYYFLPKCNSNDMTNLLLKKKYDSKIYELNTTIDNLRRVNMDLRDRFNESKMKITSLEMTISDLNRDIKHQVRIFDENQLFYSRFIFIKFLAYILKFFNFY